MQFLPVTNLVAICRINPTNIAITFKTVTGKCGQVAANWLVKNLFAQVAVQ